MAKSSPLTISEKDFHTLLSSVITRWLHGKLSDSRFITQAQKIASSYPVMWNKFQNMELGLVKYWIEEINYYGLDEVMKNHYDLRRVLEKDFALPRNNYHISKVISCILRNPQIIERTVLGYILQLLLKYDYEEYQSIRLDVESEYQFKYDCQYMSELVGSFDKIFFAFTGKVPNKKTHNGCSLLLAYMKEPEITKKVLKGVHTYILDLGDFPHTRSTNKEKYDALVKSIKELYNNSK